MLFPAFLVHLLGVLPIHGDGPEITSFTAAGNGELGRDQSPVNCLDFNSRGAEPSRYLIQNLGSYSAPNTDSCRESPPCWLSEGYFFPVHALPWIAFDSTSVWRAASFNQQNPCWFQPHPGTSPGTSGRVCSHFLSWKHWLHRVLGSFLSTRVFSSHLAFLWGHSL